MTREQQLKFCKKCTNRRLDMKVGLLCNLTGEMAHFENECKSFNLDEAVVEKIDDTEAVELLWGAITVATGYQIGFMAIAVGALVGLSIRFVGKGVDKIFGISGGIIAVLSCVLGNFFSIIGFIANTEGLGYFETLNVFNYSQLIPIMIETFSGIDLLFYGIAAYEGYKFSFRTFTEKDLYELEK